MIIVDDGIQYIPTGGRNEGCCHEGNLRRCWVGFTFTSSADTSTTGSKSVLEEPKNPGTGWATLGMEPGSP